MIFEASSRNVSTAVNKSSNAVGIDSTTGAGLVGLVHAERLNKQARLTTQAARGNHNGFLPASPDCLVFAISRRKPRTIE